jgi:hypothetical protein
MLRFMRERMSPDLLERLVLDRHALHCTQVEFETEKGVETFSAPAPADLAAFERSRMGSSHLAGGLSGLSAVPNGRSAQEGAQAAGLPPGAGRHRT